MSIQWPFTFIIIMNNFEYFNKSLKFFSKHSISYQLSSETFHLISMLVLWFHFFYFIKKFFQSWKWFRFPFFLNSPLRFLLTSFAVRLQKWIMISFYSLSECHCLAQQTVSDPSFSAFSTLLKFFTVPGP